MGPLVQGPKLGRRDKIRIMATFGTAFVAGALVIFATLGALGAAVGAVDPSAGWRHGVGAAGLMGLAAIDLAAVRAARYCPLGWRRQTPKSLVRHYPPLVVVGVWGFDTGLAVTTFRVAALTWGALLVVALGLGHWWYGAFYGVGFVVPLLGLLCWHPAGRIAWQPGSKDTGVLALARWRPAAQLASAALLLAGGAVLLV